MLVSSVHGLQRSSLGASVCSLVQSTSVEARSTDVLVNLFDGPFRVDHCASGRSRLAQFRSEGSLPVLCFRSATEIKSAHLQSNGSCSLAEERKENEVIEMSTS